MCDDPKTYYEPTYEGSCSQRPRYPPKCGTLPPLSCTGLPERKYQCVRVGASADATSGSCPGEGYTSFQPYVNPLAYLKHQEYATCTAAAGNNKYGYDGTQLGDDGGGPLPDRCGPQILQNSGYDNITSGTQLAGNTNQAVLMSRTRVAASRFLGYGWGCAGCYKYSASAAGGTCGKFRTVPNPLALPPTLRLM